MVTFDFIRVVLDRSPPQRPNASGSGGTTIKRIKICTPTAGSPVAPDFTAEGTVSLPDTSCVACSVGAHAATNINNVMNTWSADFNNTPVGPATLTATGDMGSADTIPIDVVAMPGPMPMPEPCVDIEMPTREKDGGVEIAAVTVKRCGDPPPDGPAFRLIVVGGRMPNFSIGGRVRPASGGVTECLLGNHPADEIYNDPGGAWSASFSGVPPANYSLQVTTNDGSRQRVVIDLEVGQGTDHHGHGGHEQVPRS